MRLGRQTIVRGCVRVALLTCPSMRAAHARRPRCPCCPLLPPPLSLSSLSSFAAEVVSDRLRMAEVATAELPRVGVTQLMAEMGSSGWSSTYFDVLQVRARAV